MGIPVHRRRLETAGDAAPCALTVAGGASHKGRPAARCSRLRSGG